MTLRHILLHRSRGALAAAGTIAFILAGMMQGGSAQAAVRLLAGG